MMSSRTRSVYGAVCAMLSLICFFVAWPAKPERRLVVTPSDYDFGDVRQGDLLRFLGTIANKSNAVLLLRRMRAR